MLSSYIRFDNKIKRFTNILLAHTSKEFENKVVKYSTIKTINSIQLKDDGGGFFRVEFKLESALYRMIRNIVGTSLSVSELERNIHREITFTTVFIHIFEFIYSHLIHIQVAAGKIKITDAENMLHVIVYGYQR
jgi:hypothetical protein